MKRFQLFVHRYYDGIKLLLSLIILILVTYSLLNQIQLNADASEDRARAVLKLSQTIQDESATQTELINRQFQALCFLVVETAGTDALKQLDPSLEKRCRNLAAELKDEARDQQAEQAGDVQASQGTAPTPTDSQSAPTATLAPARGEATEGVEKSDNPTTSGPVPQPDNTDPQPALNLPICIPLLTNCNGETLKAGGDI